MTFSGIFMVALVGGLIGGLTGRGALPVPNHPQREVARSTGGGGGPALLTLSDLPSGWVSAGGAAAQTRVSPWSKQLAECVGVPAKVAALRPGKVNSPEFTTANRELAVEDSISMYGSAGQARADYAALADPKLPACMNTIGGAALRTSIQNQAGSGATVGTVTIAALAPGSYTANETGFTVTIPLTSGGRALTITSTEIAFVKGAAVRQLTFNGNGAAFPASLETQLVNAAQGRH